MNKQTQDWLPAPSWLPSAITFTDQISSVWPTSVSKHSPLNRHHTFIVLSLLPLISLFLSNSVKQRIPLVWPFKLFIIELVFKFHTLIFVWLNEQAMTFCISPDISVKYVCDNSSVPNDLNSNVFATLGRNTLRFRS